MARFSLMLAFGLSIPVALAGDPSPISPDQGPVSVQPPAARLPDSWAQGPFFEIYVRGFKDSNGDGRGDLQGVIDKLDYVQSLGFTGIWLMPVFESEDRNHGYAVRNYRRIEPAYGNEADLQRLIDAAHARGIGIILDYTANQAGSTHPIFEASTDRNSPYRNWFVWEDEKPEGWSGFTGDSWHERNGSWYYGVYDTIMPDYNWRNPAVMDFHLNNLRYWLNRGVDGFRLDAIDPLVENGPLAWRNQPETLAVTHRFGQELKRYPGVKYQVCEAPVEPTLFAAEDACGSAFAFGLQKAILKSVNFGRIDRELPAYLEQQTVARMGTFLSNHDSFPGIRIYNQVDGDLAAYKLAAATQYLLPGIPFTFYGEEIGMAMSSSAGGVDEQIRAPMPWSDEESATLPDGTTGRSFAGFSVVPPGRERRLFRPLPDNWKQFNVASQQADRNGLLQHYRQLIALRRQHPALAIGSYRRIAVEAAGTSRASSKAADEVFAFIREHGQQRLLVLINYARREQQLRIALPVSQTQPLAGAGQRNARPGKKGTILTLPAQAFAVYPLE